MPKHGKRFTAASGQIDPEGSYSPREALEFVKANAGAKFDETIEATYRLAIDSRHADQNVRGTVAMPHGTGQSIRVAVFATGEKAQEAEDAGADLVGGKELAEAIQGGRALDFDLTIATPDLMSEVGKVGKILGPRGLMPNPKAGTVTFEVEKAVGEIKAGRVEFRVDKTAIIHNSLGKKSFPTDHLVANARTLLGAILRARPPAAKGKYIRSATLSSSMGPGIRLDTAVVESLG